MPDTPAETTAEPITASGRKDLTDEEYNELLAAQGHSCAICGGVDEDGRNLSVDHDHKTGYVRGLLCSQCNLGLGCFKDEHDRLKGAIDYLDDAVIARSNGKFTPESAAAFARRKARGVTRLRQEEARLRAELRQAKEDPDVSLTELFAASKGLGQYKDLSPDKRLAALFKLLEYTVGKPTRAAAKDETETIVNDEVSFE